MMTKSLIRLNLILLTLIAILVTTTFSCQKKELSANEVIKLVTEPDKIPGIVRLSTLEGQFFCSGAVISDTEVLTAAHCVTPLTRNMIITSVKVKDSVETTTGFATMLNPRGDTAIVTGDFKKFSKLKINSNPEDDILVNDYDLITCGFPYAGPLVCYRLTETFKMFDVVGGKGQMYAGMSGGPVIDTNSGVVYAINHGVANSFVLVAPTISLRQGMYPIPLE